MNPKNEIISTHEPSHTRTRYTVSVSVFHDLIDNEDVKTNNVHFYVRRNDIFRLQCCHFFWLGACERGKCNELAFRCSRSTGFTLKKKILRKEIWWRFHECLLTIETTKWNCIMSNGMLDLMTQFSGWPLARRGNLLKWIFLISY